MWSIYNHPAVYRLGMRLSYRSEYRERYSLLAEYVGRPSHVLEVCCGDLVLHGQLARRGLLRSYRGVERSPSMVALAHRQGVRVDRLDLRAAAELPRAEIVIMQASLYQFHDLAETLLPRLWNAAERQLLVAEPVRNLSSSGNPVMRWAGQLMSRTDEGPHPFRYTEQTLLQLYERCGIPITRVGRTRHGRELIVSSCRPGIARDG